MKEFLKKLLKARTDRMNEIRSAIDASTDVNEVRNLTKEATALQAEINDLNSQIASLDEQRDAVPASAQHVNGNITASFTAPAKAEEKREVNPLESLEYR